MGKSLAHRGVMAIAYDVHEATAVGAHTLNRPLAGDVPLIRHEDREDEHKETYDQGDREALKTPIRGLIWEGRPGHGHVPPSSLRH